MKAYVATAGQSNAKSLRQEDDNNESGFTKIQDGLINAGLFDEVIVENQALGGSAADGDNYQELATKPEFTWWHLSTDTPGQALSNAVNGINAAIAANNIDTSAGDNVSIVWGQGEKDASMYYHGVSNPDLYKEATQAVFDYMVNNINADITIYISTLGRYNYSVSYQPHLAVVRDASHDSVYDKQIELIRDNDFVEFTSYNMRRGMYDFVHYNPDEYLRIGEDVAGSIIDKLAYDDLGKVFGDELDNVISAGSADTHVLDGLEGADTLVGQIGEVDIFTVSGLNHSTVAASDVIQNFELGVDIIDLTRFDYNKVSEIAGDNALLISYDAVADVTYLTGETGDFKLAVEGNNVHASDILLQADALRQHGTEGADTVIGGASYDTIIGYGGADVLTGGRGADIFEIFEHDHSTQSEQDTITDFDANEDILDISGLNYNGVVQSGATDDELLYAYDAGANQVTLSHANDDFAVKLDGNIGFAALQDALIFGEAGQLVVGTSAPETVEGTANNDTLIGGAGKDSIYSGTGHDVFKFTAYSDSPIDQADRVLDFVIGQDIIDVTGLQFSTLTFPGEATEPNGLRVSYNDDNTVMYLKNDAADFRILVTGDFDLPHDPFEMIIGLTGDILNATIVGDENDNLLEGFDGSDSLYGEAGDDTLIGGTEDDLLEGGEGNDVFAYTALNQSIKAGTKDTITDFVIGEDKIDLSALNIQRIGSGEHAIRISYSAASDVTYLKHDYDDPITGDRFEVALQGDHSALSAGDFIFAEDENANMPTSGADSLVGTAGDDTIDGLQGDDTIFGDDGDDTIIGGEGRDELEGGAGADVFAYTDRNQSVKTGDKDTITDFVIGEDKIDLSALDIEGFGSGENVIRISYSAGSDVTYIKNDYDDTVTGSRFEIVLDGDYSALDEDDFILADVTNSNDPTEGADDLSGAASDDLINALAGNDTVDAGAGDDTLIGGAGRDRLTGGAGADVFAYTDRSQSVKTGDKDVIEDFVLGEDKIDLSAIDIEGFGSGENVIRISYSSSKDITYIKNDYDDTVTGSRFEITLEGDYRALADTDFVFAEVEATPTAGNDTLVGDATDEFIDGLAGKDVIDGGAGDDTIMGGLGADTLDGGAGADVFAYLGRNESLKSGGRDVIQNFVDGEDKIDLSALDIEGFGSGENVIRISYSATKDLTYIKNDYDDPITGTRFEVNLDGNYFALLDESDFIFVQGSGAPTENADTLDGDDMDELIDALAGNDTVDAGAGDDTIIGGDGRDLLKGGAGEDVFAYTGRSQSVKTGNKDIIQDFVLGEDKIDLSALGITGFGSGETLVRVAYSASKDITYIKNDYDDPNTGSRFEITLEGNYLALGTDDFIF